MARSCKLLLSSTVLLFLNSFTDGGGKKKTTQTLPWMLNVAGLGLVHGKSAAWVTGRGV